MFDNIEDVEERRMMLRQEMQQVYESSLTSKQPTSDGSPEEFMKDVFEDKIEVESWVSTS